MLFGKTFKIRLSEDFRAQDESLLNDFLESVIPESIDSAMINHPTDPFWSVLVVYSPLEEVTLPDGDRVLFDSYEPLSPDEEMTYMRLKLWRDNLARERDLPNHQILHDAHLMTLAKIQPKEPGDLMKLKGLSLRKIRQYETEILFFFHSEK